MSFSDRDNEIVTFDTPQGRYQMTRLERYRLAVLHGLPEAQCRHLAYGATPPRDGAPPAKAHGFTATELFARFYADGTSKGRGLDLAPGLPPKRPAVAGAGRAAT